MLIHALRPEKEIFQLHPEAQCDFGKMSLACAHCDALHFTTKEVLPSAYSKARFSSCCNKVLLLLQNCPEPPHFCLLFLLSRLRRRDILDIKCGHVIVCFLRVRLGHPGFKRTGQHCMQTNKDSTEKIYHYIGGRPLHWWAPTSVSTAFHLSFGLYP